ncbi:MAG: undecaprenyl-diphosphate phosphatase, partial [Sinomicrobium sp.]|nr:undecaprenyl-diphosphate phosphatase [Sinomicrobium sp.]
RVSHAIAILPVISLSGATISTSFLLVIYRESASRFSFLMVVPLILGKVSKDLIDGSLQHASLQPLPVIAGFTAAFVTGALACLWMIRLVKQSKLTYFSIYCWIAAALAAAFYLSN